MEQSNSNIYELKSQIIYQKVKPKRRIFTNQSTHNNQSKELKFQDSWVPELNGQ